MLDSATLIGAAAAWRLFAQMDEARRAQGRVLEAFGFGPQETPSRVVLPLARQLVVDSEEQLYREDAFLRGKLAMGSQTASAREVVMPLLVVTDPRCLIVGRKAVLPSWRRPGQRTSACSGTRVTSAWRYSTSVC
jgi:hypothetical protein